MEMFGKEISDNHNKSVVLVVMKCMLICDHAQADVSNSMSIPSARV